MTREETIRICKTCTNRKTDPAQGIVCGLTGEKATFETACQFFLPDESVKPVSEAAVALKQTEAAVAGSGKRLANRLLDLLFIYILSMVIGSLLGIVSVMLNADLLSFLEQEDPIRDLLISMIFVFFYYFIFESITGQTPAKHITRTKVITLDGQKPPIKTILLRTLCRHIPFEAFSFLGQTGIGWHDRFSETRVVMKEK